MNTQDYAGRQFIQLTGRFPSEPACSKCFQRIERGNVCDKCIAAILRGHCMAQESGA